MPSIASAPLVNTRKSGRNRAPQKGTKADTVDLEKAEV